MLVSCTVQEESTLHPVQLCNLQVVSSSSAPRPAGGLAGENGDPCLIGDDSTRKGGAGRVTPFHATLLPRSANRRCSLPVPPRETVTSHLPPTRPPAYSTGHTATLREMRTCSATTLSARISRSARSGADIDYYY